MSFENSNDDGSMREIREGHDVGDILRPTSFFILAGAELHVHRGVPCTRSSPSRKRKKIFHTLSAPLNFKGCSSIF